MLIVMVQVHVKDGCAEAFAAASAANAAASVREPGIARFDVLRAADDPNRFILHEAYRDQAAAAAHKETAHYAAWRDAVADLMAEPRQGLRYENVWPADQEW
jgi:quinol monooxygenase YgiN